MPANWDGEMSDEEVKDEVTIRSVITLAEACYMWKKSPKQLMFDYWKDRLVARKSKGTWLVLARSAFKLYGKPVREMSDEWENEGFKN